eukprot:COSAG01_NODE_9158_length_2533_cov_1.096138_1_plen_646_part_10
MLRQSLLQGGDRHARSSKAGFDGGGDSQPSVELSEIVTSSVSKEASESSSNGGAVAAALGAEKAETLDSTHSPSSVRSFVDLPQGVTEAHTDALLPYPSIAERKELAAELQHVVRKCTEVFQTLPKTCGDDSVAAQTINAAGELILMRPSRARQADCQQALKRLCSPMEDRPAALPIKHTHPRSMKACTRIALLLSVVISYPISATLVSVIHDTRGEGEECWDPCDHMSGPCGWCGITGKCCRLGYHNGTARDRTGGCAANEGTVGHHGCVHTGQVWILSDPSSYFLRGGLFSPARAAYFGFMWLCTFCILGGVVFLRARRLHATAPVQGGWAARFAAYMGTRADADCTLPNRTESLPLYGFGPLEPNFARHAMFSATGVAAGETPIHAAASIVTLQMFLAESLALCIPRTQGARPAVASWLRHFPFYHSTKYVRQLWWALSERDGILRPCTTIPMVKFAAAVTRGDFIYTAKDIECIAAFLNMPDDLEFSDMLVLNLCLGIHEDSGSARSCAPIGTDINVRLQEMNLCTLRSLCTAQLEQIASTAIGQPASELLCAVLFGPVLRPWLGPRHVDPDSSSGQAVLDEWQHATRRLVSEYFEDLRTVTPAHTFLAATQLMFERIRLPKFLARVHAAQAYFEVAAGSID